MNTWGIPDWLEHEVRERDKACVYCGVHMTEGMAAHGSRRTVATWEHIVNDALIITRENIARSCVSCNSSKGVKLLAAWIQSSYSRRLGITAQSVAPIVQRALQIALQSEAQQFAAGDAGNPRA